MSSLIICEKPSQARNINDALKGRFGPVIAAQGHFFSMAEPEDVDPDFAGKWTDQLLWKGEMYPIVVNKQVVNDKAMMDRFRQIKAKLDTVDRVIIASDCDREGEVIGGDFLRVFGYRGAAFRAIFNNEDPVSLREAFDALEPLSKYRTRYDAGCARRQVDGAANLTFTRTASVTFMPEGVQKQLTSAGRVRTPTLSIICRRQDEIDGHIPEDLHTIEALLSSQSGGKFGLKCSAYPKSIVQEIAADPDEDEDEDEAVKAVQVSRHQIKRKDLAEGLAEDVKGKQWQLKVTKTPGRKAPPKLLDKTGLSKEAAKRYKWSAKKTGNVAQELYDKGLITYTRGQAKYLPDVFRDHIPSMLKGLLVFPEYQRFRDLLANPVVRSGEAGHFCSAYLEKKNYSHHAIVPNVKAAETWHASVSSLSEDHKRLFDIVARSYLAALAPDNLFETTAISHDHMFKGHAWEFKTSGVTTVSLGWREIYGAKAQDGTLSLPKIDPNASYPVVGSKLHLSQTKPPAYIDQTSLMQLMREAWRLEPPGPLRDRLKKADGIGTPATQEAIVTELLAIGQLVEVSRNGKKVLIPGESGMELYRALTPINSMLIRPSLTALWEMIYDRVESGEITVLEAVNEAMKAVDKERAAIASLKGKVVIRSSRKFKASPGQIKAVESIIARNSSLKAPVGYKGDAQVCSEFIEKYGAPKREGTPETREPTDGQRNYARDLAAKLSLPEVPANALANEAACRKWIDEQKAKLGNEKPSDKQLAMARKISEEQQVDIPPKALTSKAECSAFIGKYMKKSKANYRGKSARNKK